jgi:hypothetical protein
MPRIDAQTTDRWRGLIDAYLLGKLSPAGEGLTRHSIETGRDAWSIASAAGVLRDAYADRTIVDAHIQTALERIFPHARFNDRKVY